MFGKKKRIRQLAEVYDIIRGIYDPRGDNFTKKKYYRRVHEDVEVSKAGKPVDKDWAKKLLA